MPVFRDLNQLFEFSLIACFLIDSSENCLASFGGPKSHNARAGARA